MAHAITLKVSDSGMDEFSRTLRIILTAALAAKDAQGRRSPEAPRLQLRLLAAAGQAVPTLPAEGWLDQTRLIKLTPSSKEGELHLVLQAQGYEALRRLAGRRARLISADGLLDEAFGFDASGSALLVLRDDDQVRQALIECQVLIGEVA